MFCSIKTTQSASQNKPIPTQSPMIKTYFSKQIFQPDEIGKISPEISLENLRLSSSESNPIIDTVSLRSRGKNCRKLRPPRDDMQSKQEVLSTR